jgi:ASC-1-like (ASCH) protein|tara:strand:+ start:10126 stop:10302 length:177 start_codon:yes stop_codon:yes gene_type:complete
MEALIDAVDAADPDVEKMTAAAEAFAKRYPKLREWALGIVDVYVRENAVEAELEGAIA